MTERNADRETKRVIRQSEGRTEWPATENAKELRSEILTQDQAVVEIYVLCEILTVSKSAYKVSLLSLTKTKGTGSVSNRGCSK